VVQSKKNNFTITELETIYIQSFHASSLYNEIADSLSGYTHKLKSYLKKKNEGSIFKFSSAYVSAPIAQGNE
jgi:hypothetical protein